MLRGLPDQRQRCDDFVARVPYGDRDGQSIRPELARHLRNTRDPHLLTTPAPKSSITA